ncbi:hypothetical protein BLNAU_1589 [Blattamonas nauphoetae]|uniref:Uncharacterized protein n=1 Tax=Blattamonas nauphoetae TaxID=2049346 RepID=A0ABQ9YIR1_9EUKA|nr:hypothetical protein BLNAU_1589 [Blattamonas nauphoetae]
MLYEYSSSFSILWDIYQVLLDNEQVLPLHTNDLAFLNKPCFSSAMKEITERCQSILNKPDTLPSQPLNEQDRPSSLVFLEESHLSTTLHDESTLHSTQNSTPSSFGDTHERTFDSEDTHLSTQMPSPPSHSSDIDDDLLSESSISREDKGQKGSLRVLNLIHEIRSRRIDTSETDWDPTPFRDFANFDEPKRVPRDHFDDTIFDMVDQRYIFTFLIHFHTIFEQTGNLNHLSITPAYLTKLTHFILSETGSFGSTAVDHLSLLLSAVPDPSEIVSTVYPLLRNAFHRSNENACSSLLCVVIKELEINRMHSAILACCTDADWIAVFSRRWIRLRFLRHFLENVIWIIERIDHFRLFLSPSLSLIRLFSASNNITSRSENFAQFLIKSDAQDQRSQRYICGVILCHAAQDERIPSSLNDAIINFHLADPSFSTLPLLSFFYLTEHRIQRFLSSFPADIVIEKEISSMLHGFYRPSAYPLLVLCRLFAPRNYLQLLHPFILRGLGSVLQLQMVKISPSQINFLRLIVDLAQYWSSFSDSIQLFITFPSDQIVEFSIAILLRHYEKSPFRTDDGCDIPSSLQIITTLASHSVHTASTPTIGSVTICSVDVADTLFVTAQTQTSSIRLRKSKWNATGIPMDFLTLSVLSVVSEMRFIDDSYLLRVQAVRRERSYRVVFLDLVSHIPAKRNAALVLLSKMCVPANRDKVLELCRFGVVECVMRAVEASPTVLKRFSVMNCVPLKERTL